MACSFFRCRSPSAMRGISNRPKLFSALMCRNPRKVNASGFPSPRSSRFCRAERPNRISRGLSWFSYHGVLDDFVLSAAMPTASTSRWPSVSTSSSRLRPAVQISELIFQPGSTSCRVLRPPPRSCMNCAFRFPCRFVPTIAPADLRGSLENARRRIDSTLAGHRNAVSARSRLELV
jgi:hypothetical protein